MMAAMPGRERWKTGSGSAVCQAGWKEVAALGVVAPGVSMMVKRMIQQQACVTYLLSSMEGAEGFILLMS